MIGVKERSGKWYVKYLAFETSKSFKKWKEIGTTDECNLVHNRQLNGHISRVAVMKRFYPLRPVQGVPEANQPPQVPQRPLPQ